MKHKKYKTVLILLSAMLFLAACGRTGQDTDPARSYFVEAGSAFNTLVEYVTQGGASERLKERFAGAKPVQEGISPDDNGETLYIFLSDPEDEACLEEIKGLKLGVKYIIKKGNGTQAYLEKCKQEIEEKYAALKEKIARGEGTQDEKDLMDRYRPSQPSVNWGMGNLLINVKIKTPWYSLDENWTTYDMHRDFDRCVELFKTLIGDYDVVSFSYGV